VKEIRWQDIAFGRAVVDVHRPRPNHEEAVTLKTDSLNKDLIRTSGEECHSAVCDRKQFAGNMRQLIQTVLAQEGSPAMIGAVVIK
jgi:hypothetical protein